MGAEQCLAVQCGGFRRTLRGLHRAVVQQTVRIAVPHGDGSLIARLVNGTQCSMQTLSPHNDPYQKYQHRQKQQP